MKYLLNKYVNHKKFGRGVVIEEQEGKIIVEFDMPFDKKLFQFPEAFENFLKIEDESLNIEIQRLLQNRKQQIEEEKERKRLEREKEEEERMQEELELAELTKKKKTVKGKRTKKAK